MASRPVMRAVRQPTISYDGVEIPDFGDRRFPYGIIEVTKHCNLRCTTCFFFQAFQHAEKNLPEQEMIAKLRALQKRQIGRASCRERV